MKNMQRAVLKIVPPAVLLLFAIISHTSAQVSSFRLRTADSLYNAKMYTQSFEHYQEILRQKQYTPSMLLKMAYIQEGLQNIGQAMYFLNLYFLATNDQAVLQKMEELANKFNLEGYETDETDQLLIYYHDHYDSISVALFALTVLALASAFHVRKRLKKTPLASGFTTLLLVVALFAHLNFGERISRGILTSTNNYILAGPSAGAPLITVTGGGHRVEVTGKNDVWLKIRWNGNTAFIRENSLLKIEL